MKTVTIIQARMGSLRLPGKVMRDLAGAPVLYRVVQRISKCCQSDTCLVATSTLPRDQKIFDYCQEQNIACFQGSEKDVLDRFYHAARWKEADAIVRITADCPLIDWEIVDRVIACFHDNPCDYVSNTKPRTFPDGLDAEVFSMRALTTAWEQAKLPHEREHVTSFIRERPESFHQESIVQEQNLSELRWTLDEPEDLGFIRSIYDIFGTKAFGMRDILNYLKAHPEQNRIRKIPEEP